MDGWIQVLDYLLHEHQRKEWTSTASNKHQIIPERIGIMEKLNEAIMLLNKNLQVSLAIACPWPAVGYTSLNLTRRSTSQIPTLSWLRICSRTTNLMSSSI
ncbi:hypothetical protein DSL72_000605 [Monilinia vaccinii-corymbosi]|uniref:Uncharacterized protein n=1 Tax=Monilinia vaccinii-corymbosi TaxID=61207 RepID=A0A8A3P4L2_9HELO|nr:hypothetical protein DSL72_000605 [Monilinia vaccinii-corymbosi]